MKLNNPCKILVSIRPRAGVGRWNKYALNMAETQYTAKHKQIINDILVNSKPPQVRYDR